MSHFSKGLLLLGFLFVVVHGAVLGQEAMSREQLDEILGLKSSPMGSPSQTAASEPSTKPQESRGVGTGAEGSVGIPGIGIVDLGVAFIFHPDMKDYVIEEKNFAKPLEGVTTPSQRLSLFARRYEEQKNLYRKFQELKDRGFEMSREWSKSRASAYSTLQEKQKKLRTEFQERQKKAGVADSAMAKQYSQSMAEAEAIYWKALDGIDKAKKSYEDELTKLTESIDSISMLGREALNRKVAHILSDLTEAVDKARKRYNLAIVVNKAFVGPKGDGDLARVNPFDRFPGDLSLFNNSYWEFLAANQDKKQGSAVAAHAGGGEVKLDLAFALLRSWYSRINDSSRFYQASPLNQLVLAGGRDVTPYVVAQVLTKYEVPEPKVRAILGFVSLVTKQPLAQETDGKTGHSDR